MSGYRKGQDFIVYAGGISSSSRVACSKSCSIEVKTSTIETSSPDSGVWKTSVAGKQSWSVKVSGLVSEDRSDADLWALLESRSLLSVLYRDEESGRAWSGTAWLTDLQETATLRETATYSAEFEGCGALELIET